MVVDHPHQRHGLGAFRRWHKGQAGAAQPQSPTLMPHAALGMPPRNQRACSHGGRGQRFCHPLPRPLQAADLLVPLRLQDCPLVRPLLTTARQPVEPPLQSLTRPLADWRRMAPIARRQLVHRPALLHRFQRHHSRALGTMWPARHRHRTSRLPVEPCPLPELTSPVVQFSGSIIHVPRRLPLSSWSCNPGRFMSRGAVEACRRAKINRNRLACWAWIPACDPIRKNCSSPLCLNPLIIP